MRLVGTAAICAALAFGAAFLVGRAVGHNGHSTTVKLSSATVVQQTASDPQLASEFTPSFTAIRLRRHVKVHHQAKRHHASAAHSASTSAGSAVTPSPTAPTPTYTTPVSTPPATTTHQSSSSGQGSGTTSVGGSGSKKKKGSGTGTTSVGG